MTSDEAKELQKLWGNKPCDHPDIIEELETEASADVKCFHRHLKWLRFCILLSDAIVAMLSDAFAVIGSLNGESPKLLWMAMPTVTDVDNAEKLLIKGAQFDAITKALKTRWVRLSYFALVDKGFPNNCFGR